MLDNSAAGFLCPPVSQIIDCALRLACIEFRVTARNETTGIPRRTRVHIPVKFFPSTSFLTYMLTHHYRNKVILIHLSYIYTCMKLKDIL